MSEELNQGFSLAALAEMDTSEIAVQTSRLRAEGIWTLRVDSATLGIQESTDPEKPDLIYIEFKYDALELKPKTPVEGFEPSSVAGQSFTERYAIYQDQWREAIGLLKGRYKKVNLPHDGVIGGFEGTPGWLDGANGHFIKMRVYHYKTRSGDQRAGYDWVGVPDQIAEG